MTILGKKLLPILIAVLTLLPISSFPLDVAMAEQKQATQSVTTVDARQLDTRAQILRDYLQRYDSPLQNHAQDFVDAADQYGLDWKLVASISGVESTFGKFIPGGYNAWGWGVYGNQALGFNSWKDGIYTVSKGLKEGYVDKGLTDPLAMNRVYAASPVWGSHVSYFLQDLAKFSQTYDNRQPQQTKSIFTKTAAASAQLAYKEIYN
ncbi:MAG: hypothetical protein Q7R49_03500 [Candidatus Daviesbacteria bacterium]|nr:hypothetical protein [Candidatus Daviesbacteria bacterium]